MSPAPWSLGLVDPLTLPPFPNASLDGDAIHAARSLLGAVLVSTIGDTLTAGRIVETEAYFGQSDPASHAATRTGQTERNKPMYGPAGTAYVYSIYGVHSCLNIVTDIEGIASAVLVRALEPLVGIATMGERRGRTTDLCSGPGRLVQALGVDPSFNGHPLTERPLSLHVGGSISSSNVRTTGRVGVTRASDWPLRFLVNGSPSISGARARTSSHSRSYATALATHRKEVAAAQALKNS